MNAFMDDAFEADFEDPFDDTNADSTLALTQTLSENEFSSESEGSPTDSLYEMVLQVGEGAMGEVFLARDKNLLRRVAYKRLHTQTKVDAEALVRFVREVQITAQLEHPNVIPVYHLEKTDTGWAYAMKLIFGKTLKELITEARDARNKNTSVPIHCQQRTLIEHFINVCDAMAYAHEYGVIHRDLKPANIMVGPHREVYVMDWGIARRMGSDLDQPKAEQPKHRVSLEELPGLMDMAEGHFDETQTGKILGTPRYLAPEQAVGQNHRLDGRSDQFTLGLILQEIVALRPAYQAKGIQALLKKVLKAERQPFEAYTNAPKIPRELKAIVTRTTQRKRANRYPNVKALAADLRLYLQDEAVKTQPDTIYQAFFRWMKKHPLLTSGLVLSIFLILGVLAADVLYEQNKQSKRLQHEQQELSHLQNAVSHQAHVLNNYFLSVESRLKKITANLDSYLKGQIPSKTVFFEEDYLVNPPKDLQYVARYAKLISTQHAVLKPLENNGIKQRPSQEALSQITPTLQTAFKAKDLTWAHVLLPDLYLSYPGKSGYPLNYQPQKAPWNKGVTIGVPHWSDPYIDIQGQGIMLSVTQSFTGANERVEGKAALALRLQYLIAHFMKLEGIPVERSYLLNAEGKVMVNAQEGNRMSGMRYGNSHFQSVFETPLFDINPIVTAIKQKKSGYQKHVVNARPTLFAFYPLNSLGWYYVAEVSEAALFK